MLAHSLPDSPLVVSAYHGTTMRAAHEIVGSRTFQPSAGPDEWLGNAIYFFESEALAVEWARGELRKRRERRRSPSRPALVGVSVRLGRCLDLAYHVGGELYAAARRELRNRLEATKEPNPRDEGSERRRSCELFNLIYAEASPRIQTARCICRGENPDSDELLFTPTDHIQLAVIDPTCIVSDPQILPWD